MAAIASDFGSGLTAPTRTWNSTSTWTGGVIPTSADDVTISGYRTTINQSAISKWTSGTITIAVASTSGFPTSTGYFYTCTQWGEMIKVNYTGTTGTTFTGCTLDTTSPYLWNKGGQIFNSAYVHSPAPIINIASGETFAVSTLTIQNGGWVNIAPGGILKANNWIAINDGRLVGRGSAGAIGRIQITRLEASGPGYLWTNYTYMQVLDLDGGEIRSNTVTTASVAIGDASATVSSTTGFAVGDEISIYDSSIDTNRPRVQNIYRQEQVNYKLLTDEGFEICGVPNSTTLYLARMNAAKGQIKSIATTVDGLQRVLTVDKDPYLSQMNFKAGDKVVINNKSYTVSAVADSNYQLASYNFQAGATLADFLTDYTYEAAWAIDAYGVYSTNGANFNALVQKYLWRREMNMVVEISPWSQYNNTGTQGTDQLGMLFSYDPVWRKGHRTNTDTTKTGFFKIKKSDNTIRADEKNVVSWDGNDITIDSALNTAVQKAMTLTVDIRKNIMKTYINGEQFSEKFMGHGGYRGLWGAYVWNNTNARIKSITYNAPCQNLYITTTDTFNTGDTVYETGAEVAHPIGSSVIKLSSRITAINGHDDWAFAYRGKSDGYWPMTIGINSNSNTGGYYGFLLNHNMEIDSQINNIGSGANYVVIDLMTTRTFTHVSFVPRVEELNTGTNSCSYYKQVQIWGSPDGTTWTSIYGPTDDTKRFANGNWYGQMAHYATGTQSYRYVKFGTTGNSSTVNSTLNYYKNIGVHDFSGGFKITVNNASDFAVGDIITVLGHAMWTTCDDQHHYNAIKANTALTNYMWTPYTHRTVTAVAGNVLTLDGPVNWCYLEGGETVVKINRNFKVEGYLDPTSGVFQKPYIKLQYTSYSYIYYPRIHWIKNVYFEHVGSSRLSGSSWNRGIDLASNDMNNPPIFDGCTVEGYNNADTNGFTNGNGCTIFRNCYVGNVRDFRADSGVVGSYPHTAMFCNKGLGIYFHRLVNGKGCMMNWNEIAGLWQFNCSSGSGDNYTNVWETEVRRNNWHGTRDISYIQSNQTGANESIGHIILCEYNRSYAANYTPFANQPQSQVTQSKGWDTHAEHPGIRCMRFDYTQTSIGGWYSFQDYCQPEGQHRDFLRADYDFGNIMYWGTWHKYAGADWIRLTHVNQDQYYGFAAIQCYSNAPVAVQIRVEFEYRFPYKYDRTIGASQSPANGKISINAIQNGVLVSQTLTTVPTTDAWTSYATTITSFTSVQGKITVFLGKYAAGQITDIRNLRAYIMTNNPDNVWEIFNGFDINRFTDPNNGKKHMMPISTASTVQFKTVKL